MIFVESMFFFIITLETKFTTDFVYHPPTFCSFYERELKRVAHMILTLLNNLLKKVNYLSFLENLKKKRPKTTKVVTPKYQSSERSLRNTSSPILSLNIILVTLIMHDYVRLFDQCKRGIYKLAR